MAENKIQATSADVEQFLQGVAPERKRDEAQRLNALFQKVTGWAPRMWGPSIIGYGEYHYKYESGREGDFLATGFSPRKAKHTIYIMPGYAAYDPILQRLGKHSIGKSCLYINKLDDVDLEVLSELIKFGLDDLAKKYPVKPS